MDKIKFEKLIGTEEPKKIIRMHYNRLINLDSRQLDKVIKLKNKNETLTKKEQVARLINKIIILPDNYSLCISDKDYHLISLVKNENNSEKVIEQFILESFQKNEIVELGLELGNYIKEEKNGIIN